jgi:hypothetical protein
MNAKPLTSRQAQRDRDVEALTKLWVNGMPGVPLPPARQWDIWFQIHRSFGTIVYGLEKSSLLYLQRRGVLETDHAIRHASRVMNDFTKDRTRRKKSAEDFPFHSLPKALAEELGLPPGLACNESIFWRCQSRALAIRQGRIPAPSPSTEPQYPPANQPANQPATQGGSETGDPATG